MQGEDGEMSARDLGAALSARLPDHHLADSVRYAASPAILDPDAHCPRCGRSLPMGSIDPAYMSSRSGLIGFPHTRQELVGACLVDGARGRNARDLALDDLLEAAHDIAAALGDRGWKHWAKSMERALVNSHDRNEQAEAVGQTLELMRRDGPGALKAGSEIETLVTSLARYWPQNPRNAAGT